MCLMLEESANSVDSRSNLSCIAKQKYSCILLDGKSTAVLDRVQLIQPTALFRAQCRFPLV